MDQIGKKGWESYYPIILVFLGIVFYLPFLGSVHLFDWDEINFAESSREMLVTGQYFRVTVDYQPFWEKPPLFFWLQCICMKIFGVNEMAARLPNAILGICTLLTIYQTGKRIKTALFGFQWAFIFLISFLPFFYFKSGIIDPVFNYFIFTSLLFLIRCSQAVSPRQASVFALASGLVNGLGVLTKGPVAFLLIMLTLLIFWIISGLKKPIRFSAFLLFVSGVVISSSLWYLPELINHGPWFLREFIQYQVELFTQPVAGHKQPVYYHFLVVFLGCFPLSIFALPVLFSKKNYSGFGVYRKWMTILFCVVMILFTIVKTKIVHYSSMSYLPLSFLAAMYIHTLTVEKKKIQKWMIWVLGIMGTLFSMIFFIIPYFFMHSDRFIQYIKDPFAQGILSQQHYWSGIEYTFGILFFAGVILLLYFLAKQKIQRGLILYGLISLVTLTCYLKLVVPKVEWYVQGEVISFYKSIKGRNVYVIPVGFKTYAPLFYFEQPPHPGEPDGKERTDWLTMGLIDKPVYIVVKNTEKYIRLLPDAQLVQKAGGYEIFRREPNQD